MGALRNQHQSSQVSAWAPAGHMQTPDTKPSPLLALDPNALQLVWASCTFGGKAALACTCRELQQKSQAWQWGTVPSQQWRQVAFQWWLRHIKLAYLGEGFVVQTPVSAKRQGDYGAARKVQAAWEPGEGRSYRRTGLSGFEFGFDPVTSKAAYICPYSPGAWRLTYDATYMYMFQVISSPMLLYRLRCLFPSYEVKQGDGDLRVWNVNLRHRRTHCQADFEDLKGGAIVTAEPALEKDEAATQNLLDLIEVLCSDCCPHTYDGLVAGCVA